MTGSKGGAPDKKREMQQMTIQQNEQVIKQLDENLKNLHKYQDEPESLQEAIDNNLGQKAMLKDMIEDLKARLKADEDMVIEKKAKVLAEVEKKPKASPAEDIDKE